MRNRKKTGTTANDNTMKSKQPNNEAFVLNAIWPRTKIRRIEKPSAISYIANCDVSIFISHVIRLHDKIVILV